MIRRLLTVLIVVCACSAAEARSTLAEHWLRVQQALATEDRENVDERILEFQQAADDLAVHRLTPYAAALVLWAKDRPGVLADAVVQRARVLDPELPSTYFLLARWQWQRREWGTAARSYVSGLWAVCLFEPSRQALIASSGIWLILVLAWTLAIAILIQVYKYRRQMAHDAVEVSGLLFRRPNAIVLAAVILGLPLFVGLGPIWLVVYLFALSWAYMTVGQRITAILSCAILALLVPALTAWKEVAGRSPTVVERVATMLDERRIDPSTLREFSGFEPELDGVSTYHLVLGELVRMHGDADGARLQYQKASLSDEADPTPLIFLGNLSMEEGDIARAIQRYNAALELDPRSVLAYHNLSSAFDQSRRFQEGDAAREAARTLAGGRRGSIGIRGRDDRIRYPLLGGEELSRLVRQAPSGLATEGGGGASFASEAAQWLLEPASRVFWILALLGLAVLLLRKRWMWTAQTCSKCGKVFCPRCKTATESASYCSQCISVFLKRDMVSIEQQSAKQAQIQSWLTWSSVGRRVAGFLIPGSAHLLGEHVWFGLVVGFVGWLLLSGAAIWAPLMLPGVDPLIAILPIQVAFAIGFALVWLRSISVAWYRR
jgi:tetratricopeptide (TPR) repeat protein